MLFRSIEIIPVLTHMGIMIHGCGVKHELAPGVAFQVGKDVDDSRQVPLTWAGTEGGEHGNFRANVDPAELNHPAQYSDLLLVVAGVLFPQRWRHIQLRLPPRREDA